MWQRFLFTLIGLLGMAIAPVTAQPLPKQTLFESIQLQPSLAPKPRLLRGVSGGRESTRAFLNIVDTPTGPCVGYIDTHADHRLSLMSFFNDLELNVQSIGDTILVVRGPGGIWCNDDASGHNPSIRGEWQKGRYEVWVGSRNARQYYPYILEIHYRK